MTLCVVTAAAVTRLAVAAFTLSWTHSVEKTAWQEDWRITPAGLVLDEARIEGSGAGMEPPDGARFDGRFWRYRPALPPLPEISLASSGKAGTWRLCGGDDCLTLGADEGPPIVVRPCD